MPIKHYNNNIYQIRFLQIPFIKPKEVNSCYFQELTSFIYLSFIYMCIYLLIYIYIYIYLFMYVSKSYTILIDPYV